MENVTGENMGMLGKRSHVMHPTDPLHHKNYQKKKEMLHRVQIITMAIK